MSSNFVKLLFKILLISEFNQSDSIILCYKFICHLLKASYIRQMPVWAGYVTLHEQNINKNITQIMLNTDSFSMRINIWSNMKPSKFKKRLETEIINSPAHAVINYLTCCWTSAVLDFD